MTEWKFLIPDRHDLEKITQIVPGRIFVNPGNDPVWTSIYLQDASGGWIVLSWDYADVQFKFEIYCLSVECTDAVAVTDLIPVETVPGFVTADFLLRTSWLRPTLPNEVPADYEQVIEESGVLAAVPPVATSIGTGLYGIVFRGAENHPLMVITLDEGSNYSLTAIVDSVLMARAIDTTDPVTFEELIHWAPPLTTQQQGSP